MGREEPTKHVHRWPTSTKICGIPVWKLKTTSALSALSRNRSALNYLTAAWLAREAFPYCRRQPLRGLPASLDDAHRAPAIACPAAQRQRLFPDLQLYLPQAVHVWATEPGDTADTARPRTRI